MSYNTDLILNVHPMAVSFQREDDIGGDKHEQSAKRLLSPFHALAAGIRGTEFELDRKTQQIKAVPLSNGSRIFKTVVGGVGALLATVTVVPLVKGIVDANRSKSYEKLFEKQWRLFHLSQIAKGTLSEDEILFSHHIEKGLTGCVSEENWKGESTEQNSLLSIEEFVGCFGGVFSHKVRRVILEHLTKSENHDTFDAFATHLTPKSAASFATDCKSVDEVQELIRAILSSKGSKEIFTEIARTLVNSLTDEQDEKEQNLTLTFLKRLSDVLGGPKKLTNAIFERQFYKAVNLRHLAAAADLPQEVRAEAGKKLGKS